ncbi:hypothetical protein F5144DRAFT_622102 [Chaetomium tenue]|uniref:Uncharacterized protein n=1 Tax=Chaetomium tenue TaxID=1854479 RepID=A0ACB7P4I3_9PEZI|nr:hypothetical protein F5144DRAFT_622102 [Chaetomium globosum]
MSQEMTSFIPTNEAVVDSHVDNDRGDQSFPTHDGTPLRSTLMTLPAELVMSIMDHLDNWYDIHNLIRAYQGLENSNTTRRFQKLMFRADARKLEERVDFDYGDYPLVHSVPPITAGCWAILMGDVEVALSALEEYRVQGSERRLCGTRFCSEDHLHDARCPKPIVGLTDVLHLSKRGTNGIPFVSSLDLAAWLGRKDMVKVLADNGAQVGGWRRPETGPVASLCDWGMDDVEEPCGTEPITADGVIHGEELDDNGDEMADNLRQPDQEKLQMEAALFNTMMEEGDDQPANPKQLRWVLETVLEGYSLRASNRHPRVILHFVKMLNYLIKRGATFEKLHKKSKGTGDHHETAKNS